MERIGVSPFFKFAMSFQRKYVEKKMFSMNSLIFQKIRAMAPGLQGGRGGVGWGAQASKQGANWRIHFS